MGEDWNNPLTAASYATNLLWNKPSLAESIRDTNRRFKNIDLFIKVNSHYPNHHLIVQSHVQGNNSLESCFSNANIP